MSNTDWKHLVFADLWWFNIYTCSSNVKRGCRYTVTSLLGGVVISATEQKTSDLTQQPGAVRGETCLKPKRAVTDWFLAWWSTRHLTVSQQPEKDQIHIWHTTPSFHWDNYLALIPFLDHANTWKSSICGLNSVKWTFDIIKQLKQLIYSSADTQLNHTVFMYL